MATFCEIYCGRHHCTAAQFQNRVFWSCLYPHARLIVWAILPFSFDYFSADRQLIAGAGEAVSMRRVRDEVRDYFWSSDNRGWWRQTARIRVSGQRLSDLARSYLPETDPVNVIAPTR